MSDECGQCGTPLGFNAEQALDELSRLRAENETLRSTLDLRTRTMRDINEALVSAQTRAEAISSERRSWMERVDRMAEREHAMRAALEYTIATIENVLPIVRELDVDEETEEVEHELEEIRKLLRPEGP